MRIEETIVGNWATYRAAAIPAGAGPQQALQLRRAFYAGAIMMFGIMNRLGDGRGEEAAIGAMDALWEEIQEFSTLMEEGRA